MKKTIQFLLLFISTGLLFWLLPWTVKLGTNEASFYPFTYYSCIQKAFIQVKADVDGVKYMDLAGQEYTMEQYDSLLPMLNYRQLLKDGRLPDSINGRPVSGPIIQAQQFTFRFNARDFNTKTINLNPMFESISGRVSLESPEDLFTISKRIRFIDAETNTENREKSELFQAALNKRGFQPPAQWVAGNPNARKPYDEGWFILDAQGQLFHLKMVNGKPFASNTHAGDSLRIRTMKTIETPNRRMYGFVTDNNNQVFYLSDITYKPVHLPIESFDPASEQLIIMANMFYWNVSVSRDKHRDHYVLDNQNLSLVAQHRETREQTRWEKLHPWIFPVVLELTSGNSTFVYPRLIGWSGKAFILHVVLFTGLLAVRRIRKQRITVSEICFTIFFGICGLIPILLLSPRHRKNRSIIYLQ